MFSKIKNAITGWIVGRVQSPLLEIRVELDGKEIEVETEAERRRDEFAPTWKLSLDWYNNHYAIVSGRVGCNSDGVSKRQIATKLQFLKDSVREGQAQFVSAAMSESSSSHVDRPWERTVAHRGTLWNEHIPFSREYYSGHPAKRMFSLAPSSRVKSITQSEGYYSALASASGALFNGHQYTYTNRRLDLRYEQTQALPLDDQIQHPHKDQVGFAEFNASAFTPVKSQFTAEQLAFRVARVLYWVCGAGELGRDLGKFKSAESQIKHMLSEAVAPIHGLSGKATATEAAAAISAGFEVVEKFFRHEASPVSRLGRAFEHVLRFEAKRFNTEGLSKPELVFLGYLAKNDHRLSDFMWDRDLMQELNEFREAHWSEAEHLFQNQEADAAHPDPELTIGRPASHELMAEIFETQQEVLRITNEIDIGWWIELFKSSSSKSDHSDVFANSFDEVLGKRFGKSNSFYKAIHSLGRKFVTGYVPGGCFMHPRPAFIGQSENLDEAKDLFKTVLPQKKIKLASNDDKEQRHHRTESKAESLYSDMRSILEGEYGKDICAALRFKPSDLHTKLPISVTGAPSPNYEDWLPNKIGNFISLGISEETIQMMYDLTSLVEASAHSLELYHVAFNYGLPRDNLFTASLLSHIDPPLNGNSRDDFSGTVHGDLSEPLLKGVELALGKNFRYFPTIIGKFSAVARENIPALQLGIGYMDLKEIDLSNYRLARLQDVAYGDEYGAPGDADKTRKQVAETLTREYCEKLQNQIRSWGQDDGVFVYEQPDIDFLRPVISRARSQAIALYIHSPGTYLRRTGLGGLDTRRGAPASVAEATINPEMPYNTFFDVALGRYTAGTTTARTAPGESINPFIYLAKGSGFVQVSDESASDSVVIRFQKKITTHPGVRGSYFPKKVLATKPDDMVRNHRTWTDNPFDDRDTLSSYNPYVSAGLCHTEPLTTPFPKSNQAGGKKSLSDLPSAGVSTIDLSWPGALRKATFYLSPSYGKYLDFQQTIIRGKASKFLTRYQGRWLDMVDYDNLAPGVGDWISRRQLETEAKKVWFRLLLHSRISMEKKHLEALKTNRPSADNRKQVDHYASDLNPVYSESEPRGLLPSNLEQQDYLFQKNVFGDPVDKNPSDVLPVRLVNDTSSKTGSPKSPPHCVQSSELASWWTPYLLTRDSDMGELSVFANRWYAYEKDPKWPLDGPKEIEEIWGNSLSGMFHKHLKPGFKPLPKRYVGDFPVKLSGRNPMSRRRSMLQVFLDTKKFSKDRHGMNVVVDSWHQLNGFYTKPADPAGTFGDLRCTGGHEAARDMASSERLRKVNSAYASARAEGLLTPFLSMCGSAYQSFDSKVDREALSAGGDTPRYSGRFMLGIAPADQPGGYEHAGVIRFTKGPVGALGELMAWAERSYKNLAAGLFCRDLGRYSGKKNAYLKTVYEPDLKKYQARSGRAERSSKDKLMYLLGQLATPQVRLLDPLQTDQRAAVIGDIILFRMSCLASLDDLTTDTVAEMSGLRDEFLKLASPEMRARFAKEEDRLGSSVVDSQEKPGRGTLNTVKANSGTQQTTSTGVVLTRIK